MTRLTRLAFWSLVPLVWLAAPVSAATIQDIAGAYEGTWQNTSFGSSGAAHVRIEIAGAATLGLHPAAEAMGPAAADSIDIHIDMDGGVFGGLDPAEVVLSGTISGGKASFDQTVMTYGHIVGSIQGSDGAFNVDLDMINPAILSAHGTGTVAGDTMDVSYTVQILTFGQAAGTLSATRVPEPDAGLGALAALAVLSVLRLRRRG